MSIRDINYNKSFYSLRFNEKKEEKTKSEDKINKEEVSYQPKSPKAKTITASAADMIAKMNEELIKGTSVQKPSKRESDDTLGELVQRYLEEKELFKYKLKPEDAFEKANKMLAMVEDIVARIDAGEPSSIDANIDWENEKQIWLKIIDNFSRGNHNNPDNTKSSQATEGFSDSKASAARETENRVLNNRALTAVEADTYTYEDLASDFNVICNKVTELFRFYNIEFQPQEFTSIQDGGINNTSNTALLAKMNMLGDAIMRNEENGGLDQARELRDLVAKFEEHLVSLHETEPNMSFDKIKHPVFYGVVECILARMGLYGTVWRE